MMRIFGLLLVCSLTACSQTTEASDQAGATLPKPQTTDWPERLEPAPENHIGDGIARPMLQPMTYEEYSKPIEMGLGCSFTATGNEQPLFVATAPDNASVHGKAAIKFNGYLRTLTHKGQGVSALENGGLFTSEALEVLIEHPGGEPTRKGVETYFWPAVLKINQDEGGRNMYEGVYECGA